MHTHTQYVHISKNKTSLYLADDTTCLSLSLTFQTLSRAGSKGAYGNMEDFPENKFVGFFWEEGREGLGQAYQEDFEVLRLSNSLI